MSVLKMPVSGKKIVMPTNGFSPTSNWLESGDYMKSIEQARQVIIVGADFRNTIVQPGAIRAVQCRITDKLRNPVPDYRRYQDGVDLLHEEIRELIYPAAEAFNARIFHALLFDPLLGNVALLLMTNCPNPPGDDELNLLVSQLPGFAG